MLVSKDLSSNLPVEYININQCYRKYVIFLRYSFGNHVIVDNDDIYPFRK